MRRSLAVQLAGEKLFGKQRNQCEGEDERKDDRNGKRQTKRPEEFAHHAREQGEGREDDDRGGR